MPDGFIKDAVGLVAVALEELDGAAAPPQALSNGSAIPRRALPLASRTKPRRLRFDSGPATVLFMMHSPLLGCRSNIPGLQQGHNLQPGHQHALARLSAQICVHQVEAGAALTVAATRDRHVVGVGGGVEAVDVDRDRVCDVVVGDIARMLEREGPAVGM